jgi:hypothetical protein
MVSRLLSHPNELLEVHEAVDNDWTIKILVAVPGLDRFYLGSESSYLRPRRVKDYIFVRIIGGDAVRVSKTAEDAKPVVVVS